MRAVVFTGAGGNEVIAIEERPDPVPGTDEVLIGVGYAGLNPADAQQRQGNYPPPPGAPLDVPGLEVAGEVLACGAGVRAWRPGDRVFGLVGGGGLADRVVAHERHLTAVPNRLADDEAAAIPEAFITAHDAVFSQAGLRMGETLLVHGAAGGVGNAAVQLGLAAGARVLGTVRSDAAGASVRALGAEAVQDDEFADAVRELTDGRGVDVILELVGAPHFPGNLRAIANQGRITVVGIGAGGDVALPLGLLMRSRVTMRGTVLRARSLEQKAQAVRAFEREVVPQIATGRCKAQIDSTHLFTDAAAAFERLEGRGKGGKVLLSFRY